MLAPAMTPPLTCLSEHLTQQTHLLRWIEINTEQGLKGIDAPKGT